MNSRSLQRLPANDRGAALLAALCFTLVLALALGSYITACYRSLQMSNRNMNSGHSVELAETGMEEALWALHEASSNSTYTWSGWAHPGTTATKTIPGFTYDNNATGSTGPSYSTSGKLVGPSTSSGVNIDTTRENNSPYQPVFDVVTPSAPNPLSNGSQTIGTSGATTPTYYYYSGNYYLGTGNTLTVDGPVVIVISGYLWTDGTAATGGKINVTTNGSLTIFLRGDMRIDGGGIVNATKLPKKVAILGQSGNTNDMEFWTTIPFYGIIYTPQGTMTFANNSTYYGALVASAVTFGTTSSPTFHYDKSLRNVSLSGIDTPYAVASVRETTNP